VEDEFFFENTSIFDVVFSIAPRSDTLSKISRARVFYLCFTVEAWYIFIDFYEIIVRYFIVFTKNDRVLLNHKREFARYHNSKVVEDEYLF